jgi:hypothetical protein
MQVNVSGNEEQSSSKAKGENASAKQEEDIRCYPISTTL